MFLLHNGAHIKLIETNKQETTTFSKKVEVNNNLEEYCSVPTEPNRQAANGDQNTILKFLQSLTS